MDFDHRLTQKFFCDKSKICRWRDRQPDDGHSEKAFFPVIGGKCSQSENEKYTTTQ